MNMESVDGSDGFQLINNKIGITFSEYKSKHHQQINSQEIEHYQLGLENKMVESFIYLHIHLLIQKVMVMLIYSKIFHIKIDTLNGSLFTLVIQDLNKKLKLILDGQIQKIIKNMKKLNISLFLNITFLLEKINNSQDLMEMLHQLHLTLEKVLSDLEMISKLKMMHLML